MDRTTDEVADAPFGAAMIAILPGCLVDPVGIVWFSTIYRKYPLHLHDLRAVDTITGSCLARWFGKAGGT